MLWTANIHAGGLRYHGAGMIISQLLKDGYIRTLPLRNEDYERGLTKGRG